MEEKKTFPITVILVIIAVLTVGGYYYFHQYYRPAEPTEPGQAAPESKGHSFLPAASDNENDGNGSCPQTSNDIINGVFEKTERGLLFLSPREDSPQINQVVLTDATEFFKMNLSSNMEFIGQEAIGLDEVKEGDQISVVAACLAQNPEEKTALAVRKVIVEPAESSLGGQ